MKRKEQLKTKQTIEDEANNWTKPMIEDKANSGWLLNQSVEVMVRDGVGGWSGLEQQPRQFRHSVKNF